jgi:hypothetical protein
VWDKDLKEVKNERAGHKKVQEVLKNSFKFILFIYFC